MSEMIKKMIRSKFDKEIEIPNISLGNINKALKELNGITNEMLNPFDSVFDEMVKDIRDRQDNVMAMEFTKCIGELLRKNGVVPKMTEYTGSFETNKTFETRYGVSIDELDFSEHDKVFEDKIAKLEKEVAEWKAEAREIKKNRDEQLKSFRKAVEPYVDILHMHETIAELKQRIVELENFSCQAEQETESLVEKLKQRIVKLEKSRSEWIDKTVEWQQKCEKLESKESVKSMRIEFHADNGEMLTPLEVANSLINQNTFKVDELKELAEHLQVYCRHHNDKESETISF